MEISSFDWIFYGRKVLGALALPPAGPLLLAFGGLTLLNRWPRLARFMAWSGFLSLLVLSLPVVANALTALTSDERPLDMPAAKTAQAIVIPGGGVRRDALEYGGDTLGRFTLERVRYGAWVARRTGLPVLVTGGVVFDGTAEAQVMRQSLADEFGVAVKWAETKSRNTRENALRTAEILHEAGVRRIVLVGHAIDMRRFRAEFASAGFEVISAPTLLSRFEFDGWGDLVPTTSALSSSYFVLYEWLANGARQAGL